MDPSPRQPGDNYERGFQAGRKAMHQRLADQGGDEIRAERDHYKRAAEAWEQIATELADERDLWRDRCKKLEQ